VCVEQKLVMVVAKFKTKISVCDRRVVCEKLRNLNARRESPILLSTSIVSIAKRNR
jgi:hypothetical protein